MAGKYLKRIFRNVSGTSAGPGQDRCGPALRSGRGTSAAGLRAGFRTGIQENKMKLRTALPSLLKRRGLLVLGTVVVITMAAGGVAAAVGSTGSATGPAGSAKSGTVRACAIMAEPGQINPGRAKALKVKALKARAIPITPDQAKALKAKALKARAVKAGTVKAGTIQVTPDQTKVPEVKAVPITPAQAKALKAKALPGKIVLGRAGPGSATPTGPLLVCGTRLSDHS